MKKNIYRKNENGQFVKASNFNIGLLFIGLACLYGSYLYLKNKLGFVFDYEYIIQILLFMVFTAYLLGLYFDIKKYKGISKYFELKNIEKNIQQNLIDSMSLNTMSATPYIEVPGVVASKDNNQGTYLISIEKLPNMDNLNSLIDCVNLVFNGNYSNYAIFDYKISDNGLFYFFKLRDVADDLTLTPYNLSELINNDFYKLNLQKGVSWDLNKNPHLIVSGKTGSGKTTLLLSLLLQTLYKGDKVFIIDPKNEFKSFDFLGENLANSKEKVLLLFDNLIEMMNKRELEVSDFVKNNKEFGATAAAAGLRPILVLIDELSAFIATLDSKEKKEFDNKLTQLIQKGRSSGINLIVSMQNANSESIKVAIRNQFGVRILLGNSTAEDIGFIFGNNAETVNKSVEKFTGYYFIDGLTNQPERFFVPNLHKYGHNDIAIFEKLYYNYNV